MFRSVLVIMLVAISLFTASAQAGAVQPVVQGTISSLADLDDGDETVTRPVVDIEEG